MSKALKKYQPNDLNDFKDKLENHFNETHQDINLACDESLKIKERDSWDRFFANNTKDLASISEKHALVHNKLLKGDAINIQLSMEVIRTNKEIVNTFIDSHSSIVAEFNALQDKINIENQYIKENLKKLNDDTVAEFKKNKTSIIEELNTHRSITDSKIEELKKHYSEKTQENYNKFLTKISDLENNNSELLVQLKRIRLLSFSALGFFIFSFLVLAFIFIHKLT